MKAKRIIVFWLALILVGSCFLLAGGKKKKDKYEEWLKKEVKLLISSAEVKEFKALKTDEEKDQFIELFWAKRDPTPGTKENEFRDEWYQRLEYVEKNFNYGPTRGINCDMGKVYMFFGPPAQVKGGPGGVRPNPMGGSQMEAPPQIWVYQAMPSLGLNEPFRVVFRQYQFGYDLDQQTPQKILRALEVFPKVVVFNPDLKELPRYKFVLPAYSFEDKLITTGQEVMNIPFEWKPHFTQALNQSSYVSFIVRLERKKADLKKGSEVTFFGRLQQGEEKEDFLKKVKLKDKELIVFGLAVKPGTYSLFLGVRTADEAKYSLTQAEITVPDFWNEQLSLSSVILAAELKPISKKKAQSEVEFDPYTFGRYRAVPRFEPVFNSREAMNVLFQIYNAQSVQGEVSLLIEYFIVAPEGTYRLNPQEIKQPLEPGKALTGGTEIPLSPLKPGKYTFKIKVTDRHSGQKVEKKVEFQVK